MIALLLACSPSLSSSGQSAESSPDSVRVLDLAQDGGAYVATVKNPTPIVVACELESGHLVYGPAEDISVTWYDGEVIVNPSPEYVGCIAWAWR